MSQISTDSPLPLALALAATTPLVYAAGALLSARGDPLRTAVRTSALAFSLAAASIVWFALSPETQSLGTLLRMDTTSALFLLLVSSIGMVIARFSRTYLRAERCCRRYASALLGALSAVTTFSLANQLLLIAAAWLVTSLCLHRLLTFYQDRTQALVAAHKKFVLSRIADASLAVAIGLIALETGSLGLDALESTVTSSATLPPRLEIAALLIVLTVVLKSAQLPVHGWLIQVMEAPTPVSALLHAGVVNLGGFLLIRLHVLLGAALPAQLVLVFIGTSTAVLASLIMMTRVSVKVALAWSTCAQMGFMLMECGLGAFRLALLHLCAHSLYKAHAFLSAGGRVAAFRAEQLADAPTTTLRRLWLTAGLLFGSLLACLVWLDGTLPAEPSAVGWALLFSLGLAPLAAQASARGARAWLPNGVRVVALGILFLTLHELLGEPPAALDSTARGVAWAFVMLAFLTLFALQSIMQRAPHSGLARALLPRLAAGLYLDEWFTRAVTRVWPPQLPPVPARRRAIVVQSSVEVGS
jgi:NAD(P)H-quinone oxidoreductase subunit 5